MNITVILCTYNRCERLATALNSVAASSLPPSVKWEVLVVNNNSSDRTREVVEDFTRRYPGRFRYLLERQQGLSYARNAGIREAHGDILAFMDDDVTVELSWLRNLAMPLQDSQWSGSGGRTLLDQSFSPPRWLALEGPHSLAGALAEFDLGPEASELTESPYGANMAFRKAVFEECGYFRTDLGRCGNNLIGGEDTEFGRRLIEAGKRLRYEPSAVVYHPVPEERLKKEYFLAWRFNYGRTEIRRLGERRRRWEILRAAKRMFQAIVRSVRGPSPEIRFFCKCYTWEMAGRIVEICRQACDVVSHGKNIAQETRKEFS